jgi:non-ribosomal peptide synthase protein (TIGR01720 family)
VRAGDCLHAVELLDDHALRAARRRLNPAAGTMLSAMWAPRTGQLALVVHHLAVDGVSWRILLEDWNIAWTQHHRGHPVALPAGGTSFARWARRLQAHALAPEVVKQLDAWRQVAAVPPAMPAVDPVRDTYATAGRLTVTLDSDTTRRLLGEVPTAFHAGAQDILLIAFGLAVAELLGTGSAPVGIDVEGHGRAEELGVDVDLSRTVGWFTTKYPVSLATGALSWTQVSAGDAALGAIVKDAKEQLRALPDGLTYGLLRYLNPDADLAGTDPAIGFNYLGRLGAGATDLSEDLWRISQDSLAMTEVAAAIAMPLAHTVELNAVTTDTDDGPCLRAAWTWAPSAVDEGRIEHLSRLWFEALAGICAHVQRGGGGLTPSDIAPARLDQRELDEVQRRYEVADILPLTPLQQGLLFHADSAHANDDMYAVQLDFAVAGPVDPPRLRDAVRRVVNRHPHLAARFCDQFDEPVQVILRDPEIAWQYADLTDTDADETDRLCAAERVAVCDLADQSAFRVALIRVGPQRHRLVLTFHHIVVDGWSLPILLGEIFAMYHGHPLSAPGSYRRFLTWLAGRDLEAARDAWREALSGFETPTPNRSCVASPRSRFPSRSQGHSASSRAPATPRSAPFCRAHGRCC